MKLITIFVFNLVFCTVHFSGIAQPAKKSNQSRLKSAFTIEHDIQFEKQLFLMNKKKVQKATTFSQLLIASNSTDLEAKRDAIYSLAYYDSEESRLKIETILNQDSSEIIKIECVKSLGIIHSLKSKATLIKFLNDNNLSVKIYSALALAKMGEKSFCLESFSNFYKLSFTPYYSCHIGFQYINTPAVKQYLLSDLNLSDSYVAIDAAVTLAKLKFYDDAFPFLSLSLENPDKYIRMAALSGLSYIGNQESLNLIKAKLNDYDVLVRGRAETIIKKF